MMTRLNASFPHSLGIEHLRALAKCEQGPHGEVIFPCVVNVAAHVADPTDRYYMYYAPHGPPADICFATAPTLTGPWVEEEEMTLAAPLDLDWHMSAMTRVPVRFESN